MLNFAELATILNMYLHFVKIIVLALILLQNLHICINTLIYWMRFSILFRPIQPTFFYRGGDCFLFSKSFTCSSGGVSLRGITVLMTMDYLSFCLVMLFYLHLEWVGLGYKLFVLLISNSRATFKRLQTGVHWSVCLLQIVILYLQDLNFSQRL